MVKTLLKEIIIVILLLLIVALVFGIIFYDYIPTTKQVPSKVVPYQIDNETNEELKETVKSQNIIKTYQIDGTDLNYYENKKEYDKGKQNPFADTSTINNNTNSNNSDVNNTTNNSNSNTLFNKTSGK